MRAIPNSLVKSDPWKVFREQDSGGINASSGSRTDGVGRQSLSIDDRVEEIGKLIKKVQELNPNSHQGVSGLAKADEKFQETDWEKSYKVRDSIFQGKQPGGVWSKERANPMVKNHADESEIVELRSLLEDCEQKREKYLELSYFQSEKLIKFSGDITINTPDSIIVVKSGFINSGFINPQIEKEKKIIAAYRESLYKFISSFKLDHLELFSRFINQLIIYKDLNDKYFQSHHNLMILSLINEILKKGSWKRKKKAFFKLQGFELWELSKAISTYNQDLFTIFMDEKEDEKENDDLVDKFKEKCEEIDKRWFELSQSMILPKGLSIQIKEASSIQSEMWINALVQVVYDQFVKIVKFSAKSSVKRLRDNTIHEDQPFGNCDKKIQTIGEIITKCVLTSVESKKDTDPEIKENFKRWEELIEQENDKKLNRKFIENIAFEFIQEWESSIRPPMPSLDIIMRAYQDKNLEGS